MQKTSESKLEVVGICGLGDWPGSQLISPRRWLIRANNHSMMRSAPPSGP
jgi:hypothetical protein